MTEIKVSIICSVFNHGKYIRRCLEGFVSQKTDFNYEVLIHDDASTDNSAQVIREFEEKYPEIIKPIYQTENQFSKKIPINITYQFPRVKGKYIAICEGDDYWIDEYKLQKQVDYMDAHPDCTFCFTNGYIEDISDNGKMRDFIPYNSEDAAVYTGESREYTLYDMNEMTFVPTASYLMPTETLNRIIPWTRERCPTADLRWRLYATACGYAYYLNDKTCVYRQNVSGSAMTTWKSYDRRQAYSHNEKIVNMILKLDELFDGKYQREVEKLAYPYIRGMIFSASSFKALKPDMHKRVYKSLPASLRARCVIKILIPNFVWKMIRKIKKGVR